MKTEEKVRKFKLGEKFNRTQERTRLARRKERNLKQVPKQDVGYIRYDSRPRIFFS